MSGNNELVRIAQRGVPGPLPARLMIGRRGAHGDGPRHRGRPSATGARHLRRGLESDEDRVLRTWGFHTLLC